MAIWIQEKVDRICTDQTKQYTNSIYYKLMESIQEVLQFILKNKYKLIFVRIYVYIDF